MCDPETVTEQQLLQRLMGLDAERMTWLLTAPFGDVRCALLAHRSLSVAPAKK